MDTTDPLPSNQKAMILPLDALMDRGLALFESSLAGAREALSGMSSEEQTHIAIWTPGHIFSAVELMAEVRITSTIRCRRSFLSSKTLRRHARVGRLGWQAHR